MCCVFVNAQSSLCQLDARSFKGGVSRLSQCHLASLFPPVLLSLNFVLSAASHGSRRGLRVAWTHPPPAHNAFLRGFLGFSFWRDLFLCCSTLENSFSSVALTVHTSLLLSGRTLGSNWIPTATSQEVIPGKRRDADENYFVIFAHYSVPKNHFLAQPFQLCFYLYLAYCRKMPYIIQLIMANGHIEFRKNF